MTDPNASPAGPLNRPDHLRPVTRSAIPKVVGILGIIFASFGIFGSIATAVGVDDAMWKFDTSRESLGAFGTWTLVYVAIAAALFAVHLTGAIQSVRYAPSAPRWMTLYGILALALIAADVAVSMATFPGGGGYRHEAFYEELVYPRFGLAVLALPWPIIVLALMNQRSARLACAGRRA